MENLLAVTMILAIPTVYGLILYYANREDAPFDPLEGVSKEKRKMIEEINKKLEKENRFRIKALIRRKKKLKKKIVIRIVTENWERCNLYEKFTTERKYYKRLWYVDHWNFEFENWVKTPNGIRNIYTQKMILLHYKLN